MPSLWGRGGLEVGSGDHLIDPKVLVWHNNGWCTNSKSERAANGAR